MTTMDETASIQASISSILGEMKAKSCWKAELPFHCQLSQHDGQHLYPDKYEQHDLNTFIGSIIYSRSCKLYFDPKSYPPPAQIPGQRLSDQDRSILDRLKTDLQAAAFENGQLIVCNGSSRGKGNNCVFTCSRHRVHSKISKGKDFGDYRNQALHNDRKKNSRGAAGRNLARRTRTDKPTESGLICHYRFTVKWDDLGYYLSLGTGCANHEHHPKLRATDLSLPSRLTDPLEQEVAASISAARVNDGAGRMIFQERVGHHDEDVEEFKAFVDNLVNRKNKQRMLSNNAPIFEGSVWVSSAAATQPNDYQRRHLGKRSSY